MNVVIRNDNSNNLERVCSVMDYSTKDGLLGLVEHLEIDGERFPIHEIMVSTTYDTKKQYVDALVRYIIRKQISLDVLETIVLQLAFSAREDWLLEKYGNIYRTEIYSDYNDSKQTIYLLLEAVSDTLRLEIIFDE